MLPWQHCGWRMASSSAQTLQHTLPEQERKQSLQGSAWAGKELTHLSICLQGYLKGVGGSQTHGFMPGCPSGTCLRSRPTVLTPRANITVDNFLTCAAPCRVSFSKGKRYLMWSGSPTSNLVEMNLVLGTYYLSGGNVLPGSFNLCLKPLRRLWFPFGW